MDNITLLQQQFKEAQHVLDKFINDSENFKNIEKAAELIINSLQNDGKVISCGNGGSHCDAMHFAEEMTGRFRKNRPALSAVAVSDASHMSCVSNDYGYEFIFSRYVNAIGRKGDVLLAISTSGNSKNILNAIEVAKVKGMTIVGLSGKDGGRMSEFCDVEIRAPHMGFADRIQEIHIKVIHCLIMLIEKGLGYSYE